MFDRIQEFLDKPLASLGSSVCLAVTAEVSESAKSSLVATATSWFACVTAACIALYWVHKLFLVVIGYYLRWKMGKRLIPAAVLREVEQSEESPGA